MPTGLSFVSPVAFTGAASQGLPVTVGDLGVPVSMQWDARTLTTAVGAGVSNWTAIDGQHPLHNSAGNFPNLMRESNGAPYVRFFPASSSSLAAAMTRDVPHTIGMVFRMRSTPASGTVAAISGAAGSTARTIVRFNANREVQAGDGGQFLTSNPISVNEWHTMIVVFSGAGSVLNVDGAETTGTIGEGVGTVFSLAQAGTDFGDIDVRRVFYHPALINAGGRATITQNLRRELSAG